MISELKKIFNINFFQEISEEGLFGKWNKEKSIFYFELTPELLSHHIEHIDYDGPGYTENFSEQLEKLDQIGILQDYEKISNIGYTQEELSALLMNRIGNSNIYNFDYLCDTHCGVYHLKYNIDKLELLKSILYNANQLELNVKSKLLNIIGYLIEKEATSKPGLLVLKIFDAKLILDEIELKDDDYIFNDSEALIHSIALSKDITYIAKLLNYLINSLTGSDLEILINAIKSEKKICYMSDVKLMEYKKYNIEVKSSQKANVYYEGYEIKLGIVNDIEQYKLYGNIGYLNNIIDAQNTQTSETKGSVKYNFETCILEYRGKKANFSGGKLQTIFIEELFNNINNPVISTIIKELGINNQMETLKNIRKKLENEKGLNRFTGFETRTMISDFTYKGNKYFLMHG